MVETFKTAARQQIQDSATKARIAGGLGQTTELLNHLDELLDAVNNLDRLHQADTTINEATINSLSRRLAAAIVSAL